MSFSNVLLLSFLLLIGVPSFFAPRQMQMLVLSFNERMGSPESSDSFRRTEKYLRRLRKLGFLMITVAIFQLLIILFGEDIARAFI